MFDFKHLLLLVLLLLILQAKAVAGDLLQGLIIDRTVTQTGHEFYRSFNAEWQEQEGVQSYTLTIKELPSARWGSRLLVEAQGEVVFRTVLFPGARQIDERAKAAVPFVIEQLLLLQQWEDDIDLGRKDF